MELPMEHQKQNLEFQIVDKFLNHKINQPLVLDTLQEMEINQKDKVKVK